MKRKIFLRIGLAVVVLAITAWLGLPKLLVGLGLHPHYEIPVMDLDGRRALVVTTSHGTLGDSGKPTGVWASEMTVPYYAFTDAGMEVDVASIEGGTIRIAAVIDKQIEELDITFTPMHPECDLRAAGAEFESATRFRDMFANHVVVDGRLVTGQNQNSGAETAHRMMDILMASPSGSH